jgi:hypothetical protein
MANSKTRSIAKHLLIDSKVVQNNLDHLNAIVELAPKNIETSVNLCVNPRIGEFYDKNYEYNKGIIIHLKYGSISHYREVGCKLSKRGRQNISSAIYNHAKQPVVKWLNEIKVNAEA